MASITHDGNGRRRIQFLPADGGGRKALRLGKVSQRMAEEFKLKVERLVWCRKHRRGVDAETSLWLDSLTDAMAAKLVAVGLIEPRAAEQLDAFLGRYIEGRHDAKPATVTVWGHTRRNLVEYFGKDKPLRDVTEGDADDFRLYLIKEGLADNTVRRRCAIAKQFFRTAVRKKLIPANPFADMRGSVQANDARDYFVTRELAARVLEACPDHEWRLLFALCRFGGLRCPSEVMGLRWEDVRWGEEGKPGKFLVHSPKTEHHVGGDSRWVPLFPELVPHFQEAWDRVEEGTAADFVFSDRRRQMTNLGVLLRKILKRAGIAPWPKLFQNLRSTRETELVAYHPLHVACAWIGNSRLIAAKHYLQVTDQDFEAGVRGPAAGGAAQSAAQQAPAPARTGGQAPAAMATNAANCGAVQGGAELCGVGATDPMGTGGLEPP